MNIRRLYDSVVSYYDQYHQFPATVSRTPAEVPCGEAVATAATAWQHPTWAALHFSVSEPHYYSYQLDSAGVGPAATFIVSAFGDIDCDGIFSTFLREGEIAGHDSTITRPGEISGGPGLLYENPAE
jgi:hypothetical protein